MNREYEKLCEDLKLAGVKKGMVLMVHSSFKSLCCKELTPKDIIKAFQEILTSEGTLLMPALTYSIVTRKSPNFSCNDTPCCVGIIPETFRKTKGVVRSLNPVHSVCAWGKYAKEMTENHRLDFISIGDNSPYMLLPRYKGKILMLGCGLKANTFMHGVENISKAPYREIKYIVKYSIVDQDGIFSIYEGGLPDMSNYEQRYDRIINILKEDEISAFNILNAKSYLISSKALLERGKKEIECNSLYFVDILIK